MPEPKYDVEIIDLLTGNAINPHLLDPANRAEFLRRLYEDSTIKEVNTMDWWPRSDGLPRFYWSPCEGASGGTLSPEAPSKTVAPQWLLIVATGKMNRDDDDSADEASVKYAQLCIGPGGMVWVGLSSSAIYGYKPNRFIYHELDFRDGELDLLMESVSLFLSALKGIKVVANQLNQQALKRADETTGAKERVEALVGRIKLH